jgi:non-specific protein-tyrosine kinase
MTISQYVRRILARWRLMALVTVAVLVAAVAVTVTTPVTYTSSSQLYVASLSDQPDMESVQAAGLHAQGRMLSYAAVAGSEEMAALIDADLGAAALDDAEIRTEVPYATVLINLTVTAPTAERARDIARSLADNYNDLLTDVEGARATQLKVGVSTVNEPSLPTSPSSPRSTLNLLAGLLAGLLLALAVAAVRDLLDGTVRADDDALGAPVLGRLPRVGDADRTLTPGAATPVAEAARRLRVRLEASRHRSFLVAAVDGGDAAAVATLVAQSLAQAGREVSLVDADLRHPVLAERLGLAPAPGLTSVLRGDAEPAASVVTTDDGLRVLTAERGATAPLELVDSAEMTNLLRELGTDRHMVLVVAPPLKAYADAAALARRVDAVLLVVRAGRTLQSDLRQALTDLDRDPATGVYLVVTDA